MAVTSSGTIGINNLRSEFQVGSSNLGWFTANATDPFIGTIGLGNAYMRLSHYYNASRRTARLTVGRTGTTDGFYRWGWSQAAGSDFFYPEAGSNTGAFGGITRQGGLSTGGTITGIHATSYGTELPYFVTISTNSSSNSGWNSVTFKNSITGSFTLNRGGANEFKASNVGGGIYNWAWYGLFGSASQKILEMLQTAYNSANTIPTMIKFD